jgi:hypothetical protein
MKALHHMIVDHRRRRAAEPGPLSAYGAAGARRKKTQKACHGGGEPPYW